MFVRLLQQKNKKWIFYNKCPTPWFGPDDYVSGDDAEYEDQLAEKRILVWQEGYNRLTFIQKIQIELGINVRVNFNAILVGPPENYGIWNSNGIQVWKPELSTDS